MRDLRKKHGLSQPKFAALMGISVGTLRNWEEGRRKPEGSARVLLRVVERHPEAVLETVNSGVQGVPSLAPSRKSHPPRRTVRR